MALADTLKYFALARNFKEVLGATETNVSVRVSGRIVQVQCEGACVGAIVPVAAAFEGAS